jgi:hypothetical protein
MCRPKRQEMASDVRGLAPGFRRELRVVVRFLWADVMDVVVLILEFLLGLLLLMVLAASVAPLLYALITGRFHEQVYSPALRVREYPWRFVRVAMLPAVVLVFFILGLCRFFGHH